MNHVVLSGNLTKDPELKTFGETTVCKLRLAVNDRIRVNGEWTNAAMYFDVDVFGRTAEICAQYLTRGSHITVDGRLKWREWQTDAGEKRQAVSVVARDIELPTKREAEQQNADRAHRTQSLPVDTPTGMPPAPAPAAEQVEFYGGRAADDDDIPF